MNRLFFLVFSGYLLFVCICKLFIVSSKLSKYSKNSFVKHMRY